MISVFSRRILFLRSRISRSFFQFHSESVWGEDYYEDDNYYEDDRIPHTPVMVNEVIEHLNLKEGDTFLDMTFGAGGHSRAILKKIPKVQVFALDRDPVAVGFAQKLEKEYPGQIKVLEGKFSDLPNLLNEHNIKPNSFDGILFDLGCSSMQLENAERGFSVVRDGPLDMRMDGGKSRGLTAADVIAYANEKELLKILKVYGGEKHAFKITQGIIQARFKFQPLRTTLELSELINTVCENQIRTDKLNRKVSVGTKTFQALRIFVNNEINELNYGIIVAHRYLKPGGRAAVLTFHSGEDTIVKRQFQNHPVDNCVRPVPLLYFNSNLVFSSSELKDFGPKNWSAVNKKVILPTKEEVLENPRSRSAKLRVAIKNLDETTL